MSKIKSHIFLVDDELDLIEALKFILEESGYIVTVAENGKDLINLLQTTRCDLILIDQMMPGLSGTEVLKSVKLIPDHAQTPTILMSASKEPTSLKVWDQFLPKPFNIEQLMETISRAVDSISDIS